MTKEGMTSITSTIMKGITMTPLRTPMAIKRISRCIEIHTISAKAKARRAEMED
jgi:hypothetical protein